MKELRESKPAVNLPFRPMEACRLSRNCALAVYVAKYRKATMTNDFLNTLTKVDLFNFKELANKTRS